MGRAALYSGLLHLTVILVLVVGLPSLVSVEDVPPPIPVELVSLAEEDSPPPKPEPKPVEAKPQPRPEPKPEPDPERPTVPANLPKPAPEPAPVPEPEPEELAVPKPDDQPAPEAIAEPEKAPPPKPPSKPKIKATVRAKPEPKKEEEDRLTTILRNVDKMRRQQSPAEETPATATQTAEQPPTSRIEQATLARLIASQMARCWRIDPGARAAENLVIVIRVTLDRSGEVMRIDFVEEDRFTSDAFYRSAAENARRAILECAPFDLPTKKYDVWREMTLRFDPARMFGG
ncbi:MAG: hypothetical protein QNJ67_12020 [Kiloniellales bacterium]|nr:hypothetical protein [Kiloniellales bacterium]